MVPFYNLKQFVILSILAFLAFQSYAFAQSDDLYFNHIWVEDGLSQSTIFTIYKDQKGFMWFGTRRGLNRYDGFEFHHYMHDIADSNSLSSNIIRTIIGDSKDNLLIQTQEDINYFNRYQKQFTRIPVSNFVYNFTKDRKGLIWTCSADGLFTFNETFLRFDTIQKAFPFINLFDLAIDNTDEIWISSYNNQVIRYNHESLKYHQYTIEGAKNQKMYIERDREGKIWLCLENGEIFLFDKKADRFQNIRIEKGIEHILVSNFGIGLGNTMIVGKNGDGISIIDTEDFSVTFYNHQPDDPKSLSSNTYYSIYADQKLEILWLGSYMGGIDYYSKYDKGLSFIYHQPYNKNSIINNNIRSLFYDLKLKQLWVGTRQGISVLDSLNNIVETIDQEMLYNMGITKPIVTKIWKDPNGYIWICTYKGGVVLYDRSKPKLIKVTDIYTNITLDTQLGVFDILMDSKENTWVATESGTILFPYNKKGFVFDRAFSKTLLEDRAGRIFIGTTFNGLYMVNNSLQLERIRLDSSTLYSERINSIFEDPNGNIWIGTGGNGIFLYDSYNNVVRHFTKKNGLPDNYIAAMVMDPNNDIWVSTYSSVSRYIDNSDWFKDIYLEKGVKGKEFNPNSIAITPSGTIYIGSINGLFKLDINRYRENPYLPKVIYTDLLINNKSVQVGANRSPLEQNIMFSDNIDLKYYQNSITLRFTAPEFCMGDKVKFSYRIIGDNMDWIDLGSNRSISLVNLNPGQYILDVKAANSDGHSMINGTQLTINVSSPPWKTIYAYLIYAVFILGIFLLYWRFMKSKLNLKYELLVQKTEKQKQDEINQSRIRLFTNVSHEIGTSLTLLNIPLETLNKIEDDSLKKSLLEIIGKNVARLMLLVKKIIGLRKIETGNMPLVAEKDDINEFIKSICSNYEPLARNKKITFLYDFPPEKLVTWFDKEKIEFVMFNLLSNAFKFEPENGKIWISLSKETRSIKGENKKTITIKVCNEGSYIPPEQAESIFKRFYRGSKSNLGSGIGLNLVHSYVDIHKGEINLYSQKQDGVTFEVIIPYGETYLKKEEKRLDNSNYEFKSPIYIDAENEVDFSNFESHEGNKIKVLIVEDNVELKGILRNQLKNNFEIIEAQNGEEGLTKAKNFMPDLIISDYVMPKMDGVELCITIKKDLDLGHIPVIILSAKKDIDDQIKGIEAGADAYITKPFSIGYLNSVIYNLINLRRKLKTKYYLGSGMNTENLEITSLDEHFLEKVYLILENNIDNIQFGIPEFIEQLGVSKYMLYSKLKELTGKTPNDFIVSYRLKKAAQIFKTKFIKDTELYYKLGFNDVSYFRKCFKKKYGKTPYQFAKAFKFMGNEKLKDESNSSN